jgi:hypothetical protein
MAEPETEAEGRRGKQVRNGREVALVVVSHHGGITGMTDD